MVRCANRDLLRYAQVRHYGILKFKKVKKVNFKIEIRSR